MNDELPFLLAGGALLLGLVFGIVAQRSRFCVVAALSNWVLLRDHRQLHAYVAALGVALLGTALLEWGDWVDIGGSSYRSARLDWVGLLSGGLVFGFGSMLAGGCATRTLIRTAEGNLGALVTLLVLATVAMVTLFGVLEPVRVWIVQESAVYLTEDRSAVAGWFALPHWFPAIAAASVCALILFRLGNWREHPGMVAAGALIGLSITAGWWLTGYLAQDEFEPTPPISVSIVGPLTRGVTYVTLGQLTGSLFGVFLIAGVFAGALLSALATRSFRWIAPDGSRLGAYLLGGVFMGSGAVLAGGCNVGQGLTGLATLSVQSVIAATAIFLGMRIGLWWLERE
ncbi:MAG: YeeE/YedE family protein [Pseudomonadota bacterium]|nr:YeeE/YedE family protein [Pseudomonadota bacterium]